MTDENRPLPTADQFQLLVKNACFAADRVAMDTVQLPTGAQRSQKIIEEALKCLFANGLIQMVPIERWPQYVALDPPYALPPGWGV